jgi:hypothetical protein
LFHGDLPVIQPDPTVQPPTAASVLAAVIASTSVQVVSSTMIVAARKGWDRTNSTASVMLVVR